MKLVASISRPSIRKIILEKLANDPSFQKAIREIAKNTIRRKVQLNSSQITKLRRHKRTINSLSKKKLSAARKRELIVQSGGFLPILIPAITAILGEIIRSAN